VCECVRGCARARARVCVCVCVCVCACVFACSLSCTGGNTRAQSRTYCLLLDAVRQRRPSRLAATALVDGKQALLLPLPTSSCAVCCAHCVGHTHVLPAIKLRLAHLPPFLTPPYSPRTFFMLARRDSLFERSVRGDSWIVCGSARCRRS
jgi:hypothetical protein